jgi:hypothetical protein
MNRAANASAAGRALGQMARGKKKNLSKEEIARRIKRLAQARKKRWKKKK